MNETRKKIINKAIDLFNEKGIAQISIRDISRELSLSPGNFTYHFKTINDLINALFAQMKAEMDEFYIDEKSINITTVDKLFKNAYFLQWSHRYFFANLVTVSSRFPDVFASYQKIRIERSQQTMILINLLIKYGYLKNSIPQKTYELLLQTIWLIYPGAIIQMSVTGTKQENNKLPIKLAWNIMVPYLTDKGLEEYTSIIEKEQSTNLEDY